MKPLNLCRSCNQDFTSREGFDRHRLGNYGPGDYTGEPGDWMPELGRRCLSAVEMAERGWEQNERGAWFDPDRALRAARAFRPPSEGHSEAAA